MITVTGATGQLGSGVIENLIQKGYNPAQLTALVRSEEKAQGLKEKGIHIKIGNYNDYTSLVEAFKGTDKLLLISGNEMEHRAKQHINAVRAAREAGIKHILYTSVQRKTDRTDSPIHFVLDSHIETEQAIKESGIRYTFLRNNLYMDMLPWVLGQNVFTTGIFYPAEEGRVAYTLRSDMAEAIANILLNNYEAEAYNISNPHSLSFSEIADHLSVIAGKKIDYISPDVNTYKSTLTGIGVPAMVADMLAGFAIGAQEGELVAGDSDLPQLLNREPVNYKVYLDSLYAKN